MKDLTQKQQAIWDLKQEGKSHKDMEAILGVSVNVIKKQIAVIHKKKGIVGNPARGVEDKNPELAAVAFEVAAHPLGNMKERIQEFNDHLQAAGVPDRVSVAVVKRLMVKYAGPVAEFRELRTSEISTMLSKKLDMAAFYLDDKVMSEASARDIMLGMGVLIEKRNLLRGEPTAIISDLERKKLNELLPALISEAQRRGITLNGEAKVIETSDN